MTDLSRCAIHTITNKPWSLEECIDAYAKAGMGGISVWRETMAPVGTAEAARLLRGSGLKVVALVRGGFFVAADATEREKTLDENRRCIDEAREIGADMIPLVVGARPGMPLAEARRQAAEGIAAILPQAQAAGIKLAIEPLHPMYAAERSCINRIAEARRICEELDHPLLGIAVDAYHVWWDPDLEEEIALAGRQKKLFGFHVCDWRVPTRKLLEDRGLMGAGCIDLRGIRGLMEAAGFGGFIEVEIISDELWAMDQLRYLEMILKAYLDHV
jgi:sugar phosphate isomerase/epimerase